MSKLEIIGSKIRRSLDILLDRSEQFRDNPSYRWEIIFKIFKEKY